MRAAPRRAAAGSLVLVEIRLIREHALPAGEVGKRAADAPLAAEAYWNYLEGLKPEGERLAPPPALPPPRVPLPLSHRRVRAPGGCLRAPPLLPVPSALAIDAHFARDTGAGTPNSLLAAQPLVVTDLSQHVLSAQVTFMAPQAAGNYALRLHIISASVVGVELEQDLDFVVVPSGSEQ